jgi:mono/diheme cytochrome c family protein
MTVAALACCFQPAVLSADEPADSMTVTTGDADQDLALKGKGLYAHYCSHCHGFNMINPGTLTYDLRNFPHDQKERFVLSVAGGKNGRMPPWGDILSLDDIDALWAYVLTEGHI